MPELLGGGFCADSFRYKGRYGLAEGVRGDPVQPGVLTDLPPETLDVGDLMPGAVAGREHWCFGSDVSSNRCWSGGDVEAAFALYEWNMAASAAVMHTTGMVEVVVRNAMDRALQGLGDRRGWSSWFDAAPLDQRGQVDIREARARATRFGSRPEAHGKVVAELTLGFWRYLAASRYLTALWTPALYSALPNGPDDKLPQQRQVDGHLKNLLLVRNRAAHHEPIHRRNLARDLVGAVEVTTWVDPAAGAWVADLSTLADLAASRPARP